MSWRYQGEALTCDDTQRNHCPEDIIVSLLVCSSGPQVANMREGWPLCICLLRLAIWSIMPALRTKKLLTHLPVQA